MALDNVLFTKIIDILNSGFAKFPAVPNPVVIQKYQPVAEGVPSCPTVFLYKIGDNRLGWPEKHSCWDRVKGIETHTELQVYETTFQISALVTQDPSNPAAYTASDIINYAAYIMQSAATVTALQAIGIGIYKVSDVRNPYFSDDRVRYEASPSFDLTLVHSQIIVTNVPIASSITVEVLEV